MPTRELKDTAGKIWEVFEVRRAFAKRSVSSALSDGWLTFQSDGAKRRLPDYPADWDRLADSELVDAVPASTARVFADGTRGGPAFTRRGACYPGESSIDCRCTGAPA